MLTRVRCWTHQVVGKSISHFEKFPIDNWQHCQCRKQRARARNTRKGTRSLALCWQRRELLSSFPTLELWYLMKMKCFFAAPVARFMKFWNVPLLTAGGMVYDFSRRKTHAGAEFYLTTRVGFTFTGISRTLLKVFQR